MQALADSGLLEVRVPDASDASRFNRVVKDFRRWGDQQRTGEEIRAAALRSGKDPVPFFDESSATQIVADLRQQSEPFLEDDQTDSTLEARVFLALAQEYDRQHQEMNGDLGAYEEKVKDLFDDINAEGNNPIKAPLTELELSQSDPAEFMVPGRLDAWVCLCLKDTADPGVLVTTSPGILEHINEHIPHVEKIHQFSCAAADPQEDEIHAQWQKSLLIYLSEAATTQWPADLDLPPNTFDAEGRETDLSLAVYIIPDLMPRDCLAECISPSHIRSLGPVPTSSIRNTVIGLIQPS
ncbi:MAG: hypothetical protein JRF72_13060 [Deltaproteobacteria bacterium]|nr:hypothetical protein [Deltaproteobacteria bacterium]